MKMYMNSEKQTFFQAQLDSFTPVSPTLTPRAAQEDEK